jgi:hypothetical protein
MTDDDDQERINGTPNFELQDDGIIQYMHNITIITIRQTFQNEVIMITVNKQTGQIVPVHNIGREPIEPTVS